MKTFLFLIIFISSSFANYSIEYQNSKLGVIENINDVKENYFKVEVTNPLARFLLGKRNFVFFNKNYSSLKADNNTKYKRDKYFIIEILKQSINNNLKEGDIFISKDKYINIVKNDNYDFKYISKGKIKSQGKIIIEDSTLISLVDEKNKVKILKN